MREIHTHQNSEFTRKHIRVFAVDDAGSGGACHEYQVHVVPDHNEPSSEVVTVKYQHGPIKEVGINGITDEALLAIVEDRLQAFSGGELPSRQGALARTHVQQALFWLRDRQEERARRGVAGKLEK